MSLADLMSSTFAEEESDDIEDYVDDGMDDDDEMDIKTSFALHDAAEKGDAAAIEAIMAAEANPEAAVAAAAAAEAAPGGEEAEDWEDRPMVDIDVYDVHGCAPIHVAVLSRQLECLRTLLRLGANPAKKCEASPLLNVALSVGGIAAHSAFALDAVKIIAALPTAVVAGPTPDAKAFPVDALGRTALHIAASIGGQLCPAIDVLLAAAPASLEQTDIQGRTALHTAVKFQRGEALRLLLAAGASREAKDENGLTPLVLASTWPAGAAALGGSAAAATTLPSASQTEVLFSELCMRHFTCKPITRDEGFPPDHVGRLSVLLDEASGTLRTTEFAEVTMDGAAPRCAMGDVLRVHEYAYVRKIEALCNSLEGETLGSLDPDTTVSAASFEAAMHAAGAVCEAVRRVCEGERRNVFCATRPPGHHAGPAGKVTNVNDPDGSSGFCLLNNVAIGAAFARSVMRHARGPGRPAINRVAIVDFDVHHGNGTEACVRALRPQCVVTPIVSDVVEGSLTSWTYKPWRDASDPENVMFVSTHGFGPRDTSGPPVTHGEGGGAWFYPGSGTTTWDKKIMNVGLGRHSARQFRSHMRLSILPEIMRFNPDLILISAGFDAHCRDEMNFGYVGMDDHDYEWCTAELLRVANACCDGRVVSVLEGGYRVHGGIVSPFACSVAAHVRAMKDSNPNDKFTIEGAQAAEVRALLCALYLCSSTSPSLSPLICSFRSFVRFVSFVAQAEEDRILAERRAKSLAASDSATKSAPAPAAPTAPAAPAAPAAPTAPTAPTAPAPAAAASSSASSSSNAASAASVSAPPPVSASSSRPKKRRRRSSGPAIDYVALNKQLEEEKARKAAAAAAAAASS